MARAYGAVVAGIFAVLVVACDDTGHARGPPESPLKFDNTWVRAPVAGSTVTAAYCDVTNPADRPVDIIGFDGDHPGLRVEIHETTEHDGMMQMRRLKRVTIPAKGTVSFAPGGKHLMLFGFDGSAAEVTLSATLDGGETLAVVFPTRPEQHR